MIRNTQATKRTLSAACALVAAVALTGCGGADSPGTVEVLGKDYSYEGLPETVEAGTTLTLRNESASELHEIVAVRLDDAEDRDVAEIMQLPPGELQAVLGPPAAVIIAPPNEVGRLMVGSQLFDKPGRYALFCSIPTDADPDEYMAAASASVGPPDVPGGPPHFVEGMWAELVVNG